MMMNVLPLQADGNLTYLQFIAVVKKLWEDSHSGIPIVPIQGTQYAEYPVITYNLDIRRPHSDEPKRKMREMYSPTGGTDVRTIWGQRFMNIVRFTAVDTNPKKAEQIIEAFEDFMVEYTPVLKRLGASELTYSRRYQDNDEVRSGEDVATRAVGYSLTTEKLYEVSSQKIEKIVLDVRTYLENNTWEEEEEESATPVIETHIVDLYEDSEAATPLD